MPEDVDWKDWPVFEVLQSSSGLSIGTLRSRLASVPCYRCTDKTVRYEPAAAQAALERDDDDDQEDDDDPAAGIDGETLRTNSGVFAIVAMLVREQMKMNLETRRERQETVRVMQGPLELGLKLIEQATATQAKRVEHLEGLWDRMIKTTEDLMQQLHARELEKQRQADSLAMKRGALDLLNRNAPMIMSKWALTTEAQLALEFLGSLDPAIVDTVRGAGVLTSEQSEMLARLQASLSKRKPPEQQPEPEPTNHGVS